MQAITPSREGPGPGAPTGAKFDDELMVRVQPLVDVFTDEELERMDHVDGPLVFCLLDAEGLPISGVIYDELTGRRTKFKLPIAGKAVA
jgi:hypothetical protein